jgi:transmembrane sensor
MIRDVLTLSRLRAMPPDEAAALWTVRLAEGELPHERELFEEWLQLDEANRTAWKRTQRGWAAFDDSAGDELLEAIRRHARAARPIGMERWSRFAAAAALFLIVVTGSLIASRAGMFGHGSERIATSSSTQGPSAPIYYATARELPRLVTLPDGSRMTLDAGTRVAAVFRPDRRNLEILGGRAFFAVKHDSSRPFVVHARNLQIMAIGTRFDVRLAGSETSVTLVEGRLSVKSASAPKPLRMSAGQQLTVIGGASPMLSRADVDDATRWQQGFETFDDETLAQAAAELNRYPGERIVISDPKVAALRVTGMFRAGDPERFARTLEEIYPVHVVRNGKHDLEIVAES